MTAQHSLDNQDNVWLMQNQLDFDTSQFNCAGFPGEIMLRLLKMLVLPLVAGSMIAGVTQQS